MPSPTFPPCFGNVRFKAPGPLCHAAAVCAHAATLNWWAKGTLGDLGSRDEARVKLPVAPGKVACRPKATEIGALEARARLPALKAQDLPHVSPVPLCNIVLLHHNKVSPQTPVQAGHAAAVRRHAPGRPCPHFPHLSAPPRACQTSPVGSQSPITTWRSAWHCLMGLASTAGRVQTFMTSPGKICLGKRQRLRPASEDSGRCTPSEGTHTGAAVGRDEAVCFARNQREATSCCACGGYCEAATVCATCACRIEASMSWRLVEARLSV